MGMKFIYKHALIASLAAATVGGIISAVEHRKKYADDMQLEERVQEIQEQAGRARNTAEHAYEEAGARINNGMLSLRYGNTSNTEDIAFALGAITVVCGGLYLLGKSLRK